MPEIFSRFDAAGYIKTDEDIAAYLEASSAEGDPSTMAATLGTIARTRNISQLARETGMTRERIYRQARTSDLSLPSKAQYLDIHHGYGAHPMPAARTNPQRRPAKPSNAPLPAR